MSSFMTRTFALILALFVFSLGQPIRAEPLDWKYPAVELSAEAESQLDEAKFLADAGAWAIASQKYRAVADQYSGTSMEAELLESITTLEGFVGGPQAANLVRQEIIQKFPDSIYEYSARISIAKSELLGQDLEQKFLHLTAVASDIAGFDLSGARSSSSAELAARMRTLNFEKRISVENLYETLFYLHRNAKRTEEALNLCVFGRQAFDLDPYNSAAFALELPSALRQTAGNRARLVGQNQGDLNLTIDTPESGGTVGTTPTVSFYIKSGDFRQAMADIGTIQVSVDGVSVKDTISAAIEYDFSLTDNVDFETINVSFTPNLQPGTHTIAVRARPNSARDDAERPEAVLEWSFTVTDNPPDPTSVTLPTTKDSILVERNQHENEGANPLLTLEKIQGKATRSAVGFDLDGVNLNGLTSAKLVLTVDPSESVTGWGNGETVTVSAITTPWVEGNGRHFGLNNNQQDDRRIPCFGTFMVGMIAESYSLEVTAL